MWPNEMLVVHAKLALVHSCLALVATTMSLCNVQTQGWQFLYNIQEDLLKREKKLNTSNLITYYNSKTTFDKALTMKS